MRQRRPPYKNGFGSLPVGKKGCELRFGMIERSGTPPNQATSDSSLSSWQTGGDSSIPNETVEKGNLAENLF